MKFVNRNRQWVYLFFVAIAIVFINKLIDNFDVITNGIGLFFKAIRPFIIGFVIAYLLNQPCNSVAKLFKKTKLKFLVNHADSIGVGVVYIGIVVLFVLLMRILVPAVYSNVLDLCNNLPGYAEEMMVFINNLQDNLGIYLINTESFSFMNAIKYFIKEVDLSQFGKYAEGIISATSGVINVFIAIIVSIYICIDKKKIKSGFKRVTGIFFSKSRAESIFEYVGKVNEIFSKYIYCKLIEALIITVIATIVLSLLNIRYALIFGIIIGIFNLIPYFGSIISTIITVIITFFSTGALPALWTLVALIVLEQIDGNFIGPKIIGNMLDMRPLWVIFSVTVGGGLFGMLGLLLSVPIMIVIKMIFTDILNAKERQQMLKKQTRKDSE